jgi:hypothetical protein
VLQRTLRASPPLLVERLTGVAGGDRRTGRRRERRICRCSGEAFAHQRLAHLRVRATSAGARCVCKKRAALRPPASHLAFHVIGADVSARRGQAAPSWRGQCVRWLQVSQKAGHEAAASATQRSHGLSGSAKARERRWI